MLLLKTKTKTSIEVFKWNWPFSWPRWFPAGRCRNSGKIYRDEGTSNLPNAALIRSRGCSNLFSIFHRTSKWCLKPTASGWAGGNWWILQDSSRRLRSILSVRPFSLSAVVAEGFDRQAAAGRNRGPAWSQENKGNGRNPHLQRHQRGRCKSS